ncbi:outer membrane beta-barrel protein [Hymenobacter sp. BT491]|uniref:outer membrane beta-barrel protein n=1 Tax=Hymenobacter sp. BT491 TaxID=2766779 RepID=UPI001653B898|nr:outer membrane beta-barrel protein [Hymenobacter sp. BT491]MBC6991693.1 outer membrane beta-barrel protein [Hymenobacter sp. BT491]
MKKLILSALVLSFSALGAQAQIAAGTTLLGGNAGYSSQTQKSEFANSPSSDPDNKYHQYELAPTVGYFIADNLAVGVSFGLAGTQQKQKNYNGNLSYTNETKMRYLSVGPLLRYYKFVSEKAAFYGQLGAGYINNYSVQKSSTNYAGDNIARSQGYYSQLLPGFVFFPTDKFGLELTMRGFSYNHLEQKLDDKSDDKYVNNGLDFGFGLRDLRLGAFFYLGR